MLNKRYIYNSENMLVFVRSHWRIQEFVMGVCSMITDDQKFGECVGNIIFVDLNINYHDFKIQNEIKYKTNNIKFQKVIRNLNLLLSMKKLV